MFQIFISFLMSYSQAGIVGKTVEYKDGETVLEGYVAYDEVVSVTRPLVIVAHDWMGVGDYAKSRTRQLAELGYIAFAVDIYGKGVRPKGREEAGKLATMYKGDRKLMRARVLAGLKEAKKVVGVDTTRVAAIGYCFGGTVALELARSGAPVDGVVSFHGGLSTPNLNDAKTIKGKVLVLHGADDPAVPAAEVAAFENEMRNANVDWQLISYGGAVHSFSNPAAGSDVKSGNAYNQKADIRSWAAMQSFFKEIF